MVHNRTPPSADAAHPPSSNRSGAFARSVLVRALPAARSSIASGPLHKTRADTGRPWRNSLALTALGVVYGDIGTSPIFTMNVVFSRGGGIAASDINVLGVLSLIFWSFFAMVPAHLLVPLILLAAAATLIASQALITGSYSLLKQLAELDYYPRLRHTSALQSDRIYVPAANWLLMGGTLLLVLLFLSSDELASAYGSAIGGVALITSESAFSWRCPASATWRHRASTPSSPCWRIAATPWPQKI